MRLMKTDDQSHLSVNVVDGIQDKAGLAAEQLVLSLCCVHSHHRLYLSLRHDPVEVLLHEHASRVMMAPHQQAHSEIL